MRGGRILLVEDEAPKCAHIERFLKGVCPGLTVTVARSVNSALDALDEVYAGPPSTRYVSYDVRRG